MATRTLAPEIVRHWNAKEIAYLGGRSNEHWLVESGGDRFVVRRYAVRSNDIGYELKVLESLAQLGWPVPKPVDKPWWHDSRQWVMFTWLPGVCRPPGSGPEESRRRGRLLAQLHESMTSLDYMGQRAGYARSEQVIRDPELLSAVQRFERAFPSEGALMREYLERARNWLDRAQIESLDTTVIHGDFARWNLLFVGNRLTGILDFEVTHFNYRIADFALAWRGGDDEVLRGYEDVSKLSDAEWELLVPVYWAWLFIGVRGEIDAILSGRIAAHRFQWQIDHLLQRTALIKRLLARYSEK